MNEYQIKAMFISIRIKKLIFERLDNMDMRALLLTNRYNAVKKIAFPKVEPLTMGGMFDDWYSTRAFESKL